MKKNLITGKRHFIKMLVMLCVMCGLSGCTPKTVPEEDHTAPEGSIDIVITAGINEVITEASFNAEYTDSSEFWIGFRNPILMKNETGLKALFHETLTKAVENEQEDIAYTDLIDVTWEAEVDSWNETGVTADELEKEFKPEQSGLYRIEVVSVDLYGNADISRCYIIADLEAPAIHAEDIEVTAEGDFFEYMESCTKGVIASDNLYGDMTNALVMTNTELIETTDDSVMVEMDFELQDIAGNVTTAKRHMTVKEILPVQTEQPADLETGFDRIKAEQAFLQVNQQRAAEGLHALAWDEALYDIACNRAQQIVNDFSHNGCPDHLGENIAANYQSITNLINGWMNSQGHKENILDSRYTAGVMGCYCYNGSYYWVNLFRF